MGVIPGILARKVGMTQIFTENGERVGVTVLQAGPCKVLQVKTNETDGYEALQIGFGDKKEKNTTKPLQGHFKKAGSVPKRFIKEIRLSEPAEQKVGDEITLEQFEGVGLVDVTGTSKGKGYAGAIKRWNFRSNRMSHGNSIHHRSPGSLGRQMSTNKGVPKGKKMTGHLGDEKITVIGLKVIRVDTANNLLLVKGSIPGANGTHCVVRHSMQEAASKVVEAKNKRLGRA